jgi:hypothetical protein
MTDPPPVDPSERYALIVETLLASPGVTHSPKAPNARKRFGSSGELKVGGKIFALLSSQGQLVVKLPRRRVDELIASGRGERFDPGHGRRMKEWLSVSAAWDEQWLALAQEAMGFVASPGG